MSNWFLIIIVSFNKHNTQYGQFSITGHPSYYEYYNQKNRVKDSESLVKFWCIHMYIQKPILLLLLLSALHTFHESKISQTSAAKIKSTRFMGKIHQLRVSNSFRIRYECSWVSFCVAIGHAWLQFQSVNHRSECNDIVCVFCLMVVMRANQIKWFPILYDAHWERGIRDRIG